MQTVKKALADALEQRGYSTLTQVQEAVTQPELEGADLLVSAQTGSGKTVGFGLAIAPTLLGEGERFEAAGAPLALIIAPTRELALQVKQELLWLYAGAGAQVASCVGGMDMRDERRALGRGAHIVVATPGRLRDHIMRNSIDMSDLRAVVLDEADEMLDLGFREDLEFILGEAPQERRTLMFSATVPRAIANLAKSYQRDAVRVTTKAESSQHSDIEYHAMNVSARDGENAIINVLRFYEAPNALVFCNTRAMVNRLTSRLSNRGFSVVSLSGELSQNERTHALQAMRDGRARVCVATDVAARGIDLPGLDLVIHAELPSNHETMLHRSGRTGRAGRKGVSALIVTPQTRKKAERILQFAKVKAEWGAAPSAEAVGERDQERLLADPMWTTPVAEEESTLVETLVERFEPLQIAAAFARLYNSRQSAPEELSAPGTDTAPKPRQAFGPSVWFTVTGGNQAGAEPRRLLPMLCKAGNLTKDDIGAIRVHATESFVEIRQASVAGFLSALGGNSEIEPGARVSQLDKAPDLSKSPRPSFGGGKDKPRGDRPAPRREYDKEPRAKDKAPRHKSKAAGEPREYDKAPKRARTSDRPVEKAAPKPAEKPTPARRHPDMMDPSKPIDWNDAPEPRKKKPKPGAAKPAGPRGDKPKKRWESEAARPDGVVKPFKKKRTGAGPAGKSEGGDSRFNKGAPSVGKPTSKKNKARAQAGTGFAKPARGGEGAPRRGKGKPPSK